MARRVQATQNVLRSSLTRRFIKTKKGLINKVRFPNYKTEREHVYDSYIKSGFICVNGNRRYHQALTSTSNMSSTEDEARLFFYNPLLLGFKLLFFHRGLLRDGAFLFSPGKMLLSRNTEHFQLLMLKQGPEE